MPMITLPDGSQKSFEHPVSVLDVAAAIGPGLAKAALAGRMDGNLVDTSFVLKRDARLAIVTERDEDGIEIIRHSTAHLLAMAVKQLFPEAQVTIGPTVENGFYYDFAFERPFTPEDLKAIEDRMTELAKADHAGEPRGVGAAAMRFASSGIRGRRTRRRSSRICLPTRLFPSTARATSSICAAVRTCPAPASSRPSS